MAHTSNLRKVGGSIMLAVPPALLDALGLTADSPVGLTVKSGKLLVEPMTRPRYTLDELIAQCRSKGRASAGERQWTGAPGVGREII